MLDVLMYLPRSVLSQRQLEFFLWLLKVNNVDNVPSVKSMQELNAMLQKLCGIDCIAYDGALGHKYYVNGLSQIIAQVSTHFASHMGRGNSYHGCDRKCAIPKSACIWKFIRRTPANYWRKLVKERAGLKRFHLPRSHPWLALASRTI
jgi:hypothetical protein